MLPRLAVRTSLRLSQRAGVAQRTFATSSPRFIEAKEALLNNKAETTPETKSEEDSLGLAENQERGLQQAPNRTEIWSRSQRARAKAMSGPRFEQTNFDLQVRSLPFSYRITPQLTMICVAFTSSRYRAHSQAASQVDTQQNRCM